jgi:hypothetical protein
MKRFFAFFVCMMFIGMIVACNNTKDKTSETPQTIDEVVTLTDTTTVNTDSTTVNVDSTVVK